MKVQCTLVKNTTKTPHAILQNEKYSCNNFTFVSHHLQVFLVAVKEMMPLLQAVKPLREEQNLVREAAVVHQCHLTAMLLLLSLTQSWPPHPLPLVIHSMLGMVHGLQRGSMFLISIIPACVIT